MMILAEAIANSSGNKASAISDNGGRVFVQERYASVTDSWLHVWYINRDGVTVSDIPFTSPEKLLVYGVHPNENYWTAI